MGGEREEERCLSQNLHEEHSNCEEENTSKDSCE